MKCPNCGAESSSGKICEFCNSELNSEKSVVNITNNYFENNNAQSTDADTGKCPKCNSGNVKFQREKLGYVGTSQSYNSVFSSAKNTSSSRQNTYATIGICQNCGYTWDPNAEEVSSPNKKGLLFWIVAILFWPISVSVWFYKTEKIKLEKKWRVVILAVAWVFIIAMSSVSQNSDSDTPESGVQSTVITESVSHN